METGVGEEDGKWVARDAVTRNVNVLQCIVTAMAGNYEETSKQLLKRILVVPSSKKQ